MSKIALTEWMDALVGAANQLAMESLSFEEGEVVATETSLRSLVSGSLIALVGNQNSVEVGLCATEDNCVNLARALLGMEPEDEELSRADLDDALGEMVNIMAGALKARMDGRVPAMQIGLPIVFQGMLGASTNAEVMVVHMRWQDVEAQTVLIRSASGG
ncbi:MAG: chemotaxis protein CheX [Azonexus sp.]